MRFDKIKIDRAFVSSLLDDRPSEHIIKAILAMCEGLGMDVVAEGIEREEQVERLQSFGCRSGQGFLFGRPVGRGDAQAPARRRAFRGARPGEIGAGLPDPLVPRRRLGIDLAAQAGEQAYHDAVGAISGPQGSIRPDYRGRFRHRSRADERLRPAGREGRLHRYRHGAEPCALRRAGETDGLAAAFSRNRHPRHPRVAGVGGKGRQNERPGHGAHQQRRGTTATSLPT